MEVKENLCPKCKHLNRPKARFCGKCGTPLDSDLNSHQDNVLSPLLYWTKEKIWRIQWFQFISLLTIIPFTLLTALRAVSGARTQDVIATQIGWLMSAYWAMLWAFLSYSIIRPNLSVIPLSITAGIFTAFVGTILLLIMSQLPLIGGIQEWTKSEYAIGRLIGFTFGVGISEEFVKSCPLIYLLQKSLKESQKIVRRDWIFLGICSGLGFGVTEAIYYVYGLAPIIGLEMIVEKEAGSAFLSVFYTLRNSVLPFLHGLWTSIVGYYISLSKQKTGYNLSIIITGLAISAILHGLYNFFAGGIMSILVVIVSLLIFASCVQLSQYSK